MSFNSFLRGSFFSVVVFYWICIKFSIQQSDSSEIKVYLEGFKKNSSSTWINTVDSPDAYDGSIKIQDEDFSVVDNETVYYISIGCKASSPIYWEMTDVTPKDLEAADTTFRVVFGNDNNESDVIPKEFQSNLVLFNGPSLTGNYTCRLYQDETEEKSVYVFLPGIGPEDAKHLVNSEDKVIVGFNKGASVVLPCKTTTKDAIVKLLKKQEDGEWMPVLNNTEYKPKQGFILNRGDSPQDLPGLYKCQVALSGEEKIIKVRAGYTKVRKEFQFQNLSQGDFAMWSIRKYTGGIECCSNSTAAPNLVVVTCLNKPHCDMQKHTFLQLSPVTSKTPGIVLTSKYEDDHCVHTYEYMRGQSILLQCDGDGINVAGEYIAYFELPSKNDEITYVDTLDEVYSKEATTRMQVMKVFNDTKRGYSYFVQMNTQKDLFDGEEYAFDCCGLSYHHASGRMLRIGWKNGSITHLPKPELAENASWTPFPKDFCSFYGLQLSQAESYLTMADINMRYFECIIPRWNDKQPTIQRMELIVREPKEPLLTNNETTVNIIYDANQLGLLELVCDLLQGDPLPKTLWMKDGKKAHPINLYWSIISSQDVAKPSSVLLFMRAVKEIEGEYKCRAENIYGSVEKTFIVKVTPRSYVDYWVALGLFGGFFLLIVCCAVRITVNERQTAKNAQVEPKSFLIQNN